MLNGDDWAASGAHFDAMRVYRYALWRVWDLAEPLVTFCMLNPSTADEHFLDPTIRRCIAFAKEWGFGGLIVVNAFALRSTDPGALYRAQDPIGAENDAAILRARDISERVICAWGVHGAFMGRGAGVLELIGRERASHLGLTKHGHPKHPLYLARTTKPSRFP